MKKILIITYYWPPSGGSGVQRWLKFVKYLTRKNYDCIVYTPENPETPVIDNSLLSDIPSENFEVIKTKIKEPYSLYRWITGKSSKERVTVSFLNESEKKASITERISKWIRGNFFIPDARMLWIKPSIQYLTKYISKNKIDIIVSTGPPHSMHLIALGIKQKFPHIKWISDFRDPWTNIDFLEELYLTQWAIKKHQHLEKKVIQSADMIITVSPTLTAELKELDKQNSDKFYTITNGFDIEEYPEIPAITNHFKVFTITYAGLIPPNRNPHNLWRCIAELSSNDIVKNRLKIKLIGKADATVWQEIQRNNIQQFIEKVDYLPHSEVIKHEIKSNALLLLINNAPNSKGILTGKLFEYLAICKPILAIGPKDGDAAKIIMENNAGVVVDYHDIEGTKNALLMLLENKISAPKKQNVLKYSREALTDQLIDVIEKMQRVNQ